MHASQDVPTAVPRVGPVMDHVKTSELEAWQQLCWGNTRWYCCKLESKSVKIVFLLTHNRRTYVADFSEWSDGKTLTLGGVDKVPLNEMVQPLEGVSFGQVASVSEVVFSAAAIAPASSADAHSGSAASAPGVRLTVQGAALVHAQLKARQRKRKCPGDDAAGLEDASADGEETDDAMGSAFRSKAPSDSESSAPSVDTDIRGWSRRHPRLEFDSFRFCSLLFACVRQRKAPGQILKHNCCMSAEGARVLHCV